MLDASERHELCCLSLASLHSLRADLAAVRACVSSCRVFIE